MSYAVDKVWETDLEPGTWYRIVKSDKPRIIAGYVFMPARGPADFRQVDGKAEKNYEVQRAMRTAILNRGTS